MNAPAPKPPLAMFPYRDRFPVEDKLREVPRSRAEILAELTTVAAEEDKLGMSGKLSGSVYHGGHDHYDFLTEIYRLYAHANVLQRDMYPSATKMEGEIIAMTADMLHGECAEQVSGVVTTGGTESLINPMLVYRERGRIEKGITAPEVILPVTAHVALDKACHYFGIKVLHAPLADNWLVDVDWVAKNITANTVALVGSAGNYPHGLIDPITELGQLALQHDIGLHVDGCLGGWLLPWGEGLGYDITPFDFRVPGVTSISADTHKYGYGLKGTSVLLYANPSLRHHQYFAYPTWPGGLYASPGMSGSRSGGIVAATWAALVTIGASGYRDIAADIFATAAKIKAGVEAIEELQVIGDPRFNVAFRSDVVDVYHVSDYLTSKGWRMNNLQLPPALHFCITRPNTKPGIAEQYLVDLQAAVEYAKNPPQPKARSGARYGLGAEPDGETKMIDAMAMGLDFMQSLPPRD